MLDFLQSSVTFPWWQLLVIVALWGPCYEAGKEFWRLTKTWLQLKYSDDDAWSKKWL